MFLLLPLNRTEEALHEVRVAEKTDPLSPNTQEKLVFVLIRAGRYDEALDHWQKLPADYPNKSGYLARIRIHQGRLDEAFQILATTNNRGLLGYAYARAGTPRGG
jgi:hypothetical protein